MAETSQLGSKPPGSIIKNSASFWNVSAWILNIKFRVSIIYIMPCSHAAKCCCCHAFSKLKFHQGPFHILKYYSHILEIYCPTSQLSSSCMLKHIRECCGYGEFLDLLADGKTGEAADKDILSAPRSEHFIFYLSLMMTHIESPDLYDRIYNCAIVLRRCLMNDGARHYKLDTSDYFKDIEDPGILLDFIFCFVNVAHFSEIVSEPYMLLEFSVSNLEKVLEIEECLPGDIKDVCGEIRNYEPELRAKLDIQDHEAFVSAYVAPTLPSILFSDGDGAPCLKTGVRFYRKGLDILGDGSQIIEEALANVVPELSRIVGSFTTDKVPHIIKLFAKLDMPVYFAGRKIELRYPTAQKSARK